MLELVILLSYLVVYFYLETTFIFVLGKWEFNLFRTFLFLVFYLRGRRGLKGNFLVDDDLDSLFD